MIVFGVIAGLLVLTALLLIVPPLIGRGRHGHAAVVHRDVNLAVFREALAELERDFEAGTIAKDQYDLSRKELESRLLEEVEQTAPDEAAPAVSGSGRIAAVIIALIVPVFAIGMYVYQGTPRAINPERMGSPSAAAMQGPGDMSAKIQAMVASLADKLKKNPDDAAGWAMLGRSYIVLQRFDDARTALEKAASLNPGDPQLLADLADSLAMTSGESLRGRPTQLILQALAIDPNNQKALWLAGTAAYEASDYAQALKYWRKLYKMLPPGSETAKTMEGNISEAQALLEGVDPSQFASQAPAGTNAGNVAASESGSAARVTGRVSLAPELRSRANDDDTVFIFAKAVQGPPMPLAVQRAKVSDLPMDFELDDSMAMSPQMSLSRFSRVVIMARVSHTGNAMPQSGDLQGTSAPVAVGSRVPEVKIDQVVP